MKMRPNVMAQIYEGEFLAEISCVGETLCRYALCPIMPPDGSEPCAHRDHGNCVCPAAQEAALEGLRNRLNSEIFNRSVDEL